jgi:putative transposase
MATHRQFYNTGSFFHIVLHASRRESLFDTAADRRALNRIAIKTLQRFGATLHAYCLLPNQFRVLLQIRERFLAKALRRIAHRYSRHRCGAVIGAENLFERPYRAQRIQTNIEFLELLRSIHVAPVVANQTTAPADYRWSSHRAYLGYGSVAWINTDFGLSLLAAEPSQARMAYGQFIAESVLAHVQEQAADAQSCPTISTTSNAIDSSVQPEHGAAVCIELASLRQISRPRRKRPRSGLRRYFAIY